MSTFGWSNISGVDNDSSGGLPGGVDGSVQYNDNGLNFAGVSDFIYQDTSKTLSVPIVHPGAITDNTNAVGTANQVLSCNGSGTNSLIWRNEVGPGAPLNSIQFNNAGTFTGSANFVRNPTTSAVNINGNLAIGTVATTVPRLFSLSTNAVFTGTGGAWTDQWFVVGNNGLSNGSGVGLGWNSSTEVGTLMSITPGLLFRPMYYTAAQHIFGTTNGVERLRILDNGNVGINTSTPNGQLQLGNSIINRKIVLYEVTNNDHQFYGMGINTVTYRFQIPDSAAKYAWFAGSGVGSSNELMRLNGNGTLSIGTTSSTFPLEVNGTIRSTAVQPTTIIDSGVSVGASQQILSSTGTGIQWTNHAKGPAYAVQFNSGTGVNPVMNGTANLTWSGSMSNTLTVNGTALIDILQTNSERPGIILDNTGSAGTTGQILSSTGTAIQWKAPSAAGSNLQVQFNSAGSLAADSVFTYNSTGGFLLVPNVQCSGRITPTLIQDNGSGTGGVPSTGTAGQYLASTGTGIVWTTRPVRDYAISNMIIGPYDTALPISTSVPHYSFTPIRSTTYTVSFSCTAFNSNGAVGTVQLWSKISTSSTWVLLGSTVFGLAGSNIRGLFPTMTQVVTTTASIQTQFYIRTANCSTNTGDSCSFYISELT